MPYDSAFTPSADTMVTPQQQAGRNSEAVAILQQELQKAKSARASAASAADQSRADGDIAALTRELGRYGVNVPVTPVAQPVQQAAAPSQPASQPATAPVAKPAQQPRSSFDQAVDWMAMHAEPLIRSAPGVFLVGAGRGATAGLIKYPAAAITYATSDKNWQQSVDQAQKTYGQLEQAHPVANLAGQVTGAVVGPGKGIGALGKGAEVVTVGSKIAPYAAPAVRIAANAALGGVNAYSNDQNVVTGATIGGLAGTAGEGLSWLWNKGAQYLQNAGADKLDALLDARAAALQTIRSNTANIVRSMGFDPSGLTGADLDAIGTKMNAPTVEAVMAGKAATPTSPGNWRSALNAAEQNALRNGQSISPPPANPIHNYVTPGSTPLQAATAIRNAATYEGSPLALRANRIARETIKPSLIDSSLPTTSTNPMGSGAASNAATNAATQVGTNIIHDAGYAALGAAGGAPLGNTLAGAVMGGVLGLTKNNPIPSMLDFAKLAAVSDEPVSSLLSKSAESLPAGTQWLGKLGAATTKAVGKTVGTIGQAPVATTAAVNSLLPPEQQPGPTKAKAAQAAASAPAPVYDPAFSPDEQ